MLHADTPIATPTGWRAVADLIPGDVVLSHGGVTTVTRRLTGSVDFGFRIAFADSGEVVCSEQQLWQLHERPMMTATAVHQLFKQLEAKGRTRSLKVRNPLPMLLPDADLPRDPRHIGRVVGLKRDLPIPVAFRRGSEAQRKAVLAGLMAGGATWNPSRRRCSFITQDHTCAHSVLELLVTFGVTPQFTVAGKSLRIEWTPPFNPFDDGREVECRTPEQSSLRTIVSVGSVAMDRGQLVSTTHKTVLAGPLMVPVLTP